MCSAGDFETAANGVLSTYASLISNITDAVLENHLSLVVKEKGRRIIFQVLLMKHVASLDRGYNSSIYVFKELINFNNN